MPIRQNGGGQIVYTEGVSARLFEQTSVIEDPDFAIADRDNNLKQIRFEVNPTTNAQGSVTIQVDVPSGDSTINLSTVAGTNSFTIIQPDTGTSPTADSPNSTLTVTSSNGSVVVNGNSTTDTLNLTTHIVATAPVVYTIGTQTISMPAATTGVDGYLTSTDWNTFNSKVPITRTISTTSPLTGGGDLSANRTLVIPNSSTSVDGYLSSTNFTIFNNKLTSGLINTHLFVGNGSGVATDVALSGDGSITNTGVLTVGQSTYAVSTVPKRSASGAFSVAFLGDTSNVNSINVGSRRLLDTATNSVIDWSSTSQTFIYGISGTTGRDLILQGDATQGKNNLLIRSAGHNVISSSGTKNAIAFGITGTGDGSTINAEGQGSLTFGVATAGGFIRSDNGGFTHGFCTGAGGTILAGEASSAMGTALEGANLEAYNGSFVSGHLSATSAAASMVATGLGSWMGGAADGRGSLSNETTSITYAYMAGESTVHNAGQGALSLTSSTADASSTHQIAGRASISAIDMDGTGCTVTINGHGATIFGSMDSATMQASNYGAHVRGVGRSGGTLNADGIASSVIGWAYSGGSISATGDLSLAYGDNTDGNITAGGLCSWAVGSNVTATRDFCWAFGRGVTNGTSNSFMFGINSVTLHMGQNIIGFLGATPAAQQTGGAATAGLLYTATEQGMLQKTYNALRTFGFLT